MEIFLVQSYEDYYHVEVATNLSVHSTLEEADKARVILEAAEDDDAIVFDIVRATLTLVNGELFIEEDI